MKHVIMNVAVIGLVGASMISCNKDQVLNMMDFSTPESNVEAVSNEESINQDADAVSFNMVAVEAEQLLTRLPDGAQVTDSGKDAFPRTITIDFGTEGCKDKKGRKKKGKITIQTTGDMADNGSVRTMTFDNFHVRGRKITGTRTMTNISHSLGIVDATTPAFEITGDLQMESKHGKTMNQSTSTIRKWVAGFGDEDLTNDIFTIEGTFVIESSKGVLNNTIQEALNIDRACKHITQGVLETTKDGAIVASINFGDGTCDAIAMLTQNGETFEIDLDEERVRGGRNCSNGMDDDDTPS